VNEVGAAKSEALLASGPVPALHTQYLEIEYRKPTPGGVVKSLQHQSARTGAPLIRRFFFRVPRFSERLFAPPRRIHESNQGALGQPRSDSRIYFPRVLAPGGGQKSGRFRHRTGGQGHIFGRELPKIFFFSGVVQLFSPRNSPGGVGDGCWH
jgi:hypothetical protein